MCRRVEQGPLQGMRAQRHTKEREMNRHITARYGVASIDEVDGACSALRGPALAIILGT